MNLISQFPLYWLVDAGLIEPGLKVQQPDGGVVVIELLMSVKPDACFALAKAKSMIAV